MIPKLVLTWSFRIIFFHSFWPSMVITVQDSLCRLRTPSALAVKDTKQKKDVHMWVFCVSEGCNLWKTAERREWEARWQRGAVRVWELCGTDPDAVAAYKFLHHRGLVNGCCQPKLSTSTAQSNQLTCHWRKQECKLALLQKPYVNMTKKFWGTCNLCPVLLFVFWIKWD